MDNDAYIEWDLSDMLRKHSNIKLRILHESEIAGDELTEDIEEHTYPYVPFLHGYLEGSFTSRMLTPVPLLRIKVQYDAIGNNYYQYAEPQHEKDYEHPVRKAGKKPQRYFLRRGMFEVQGNVEEVLSRRMQNALS